MRALIAVDGSESSEAVVASVAPWLVNTGTEVYMVTTVEDSEIRSTMAGGTPPGPTSLGGDLHGRPLVPQPHPEAAETRAQAMERVSDLRTLFLRDLASRHLGALRHHYQVHVSDEPAKTVLQAAEDVQADLIVIGTHGRSGLRRTVMGSVAEEVIRRTPVPVFVVRFQGGAGN